MAVSQPDLKPQTSIITGCTGLQFIDNTGIYGLSNLFGYDLPTGPAVNDVITVKLTVTLNTLGTNLAYVFIIASGVITAATLSLGGVTPVNIFTALDSTTWPFTDINPFLLTKNYGVTIPDFADDVVKIDYEIIGLVVSDPFDFTSTQYLPVGCNLRCCINKKWQAIDPNCECCDNKTKSVMYLESLYNQFYFGCLAGSLTEALQALTEAQKYCDKLRGGCGC